MQNHKEIDFDGAGESAVAVLDRADLPAGLQPHEADATKCDPGEVRRTIGALLVRGWARRTL